MVRAPKKRRTATGQRVFIIGAGVSTACGIAVAKDILRESILKLEQKESVKVERVHKLLEYLYPNFEKGLRNYPNIEDFLNLLEMAKRFNTEEFIGSTLWSKARLEEVRQNTLTAVTNYIWEALGDGRGQRIIDDFVQTLRQGDTIITFNWDLTIERALESYPGDPGFLYTYSRDRGKQAFSLLKPHGSIDWFEREKIKSLRSKSEIGALDESLCYYPRFNLAKNPDLANISPIIVPPISSKEFEMPFIKRTWRFAYRALSDATRLVIIGYSMPREDQFARFVIRRAIRNNILRAQRKEKGSVKVLVINPDENVQVTFSRMLGPEIRDLRFSQAYFEDYVQSCID